MLLFRKIELITSYHNSDSESNDEADSPVKAATSVKSPKLPPGPKAPAKTLPKKAKMAKTKEFGPALPPNQNYTVPIGPEIPPEFMAEITKEVKPSLPPAAEEVIIIFLL